MAVNNLYTEETLEITRAEVVRMAKLEGFDVDSFTCDDCGARFNCPLVFDLYNTDGDCLMEK